ncbi:MAG: 16S rRNA (cytosine(967)-C(5))-methyltransferase RsmB [Pseudomonadota bacterium]
MKNSRAIAALLIQAVIDGGRALDQSLISSRIEDGHEDRGFVQELSFGVCRWYGLLEHIGNQLLSKPFRNKDRDIHFILMIGIYELVILKNAEHAAVNEAVEASKQLKKSWAVKVINACLRRLQRETQTLVPATDTGLVLSHPDWLYAAIQANWPNHVNEILAANNSRPRMCLRVNQNQFERQGYLDALHAAELAAEADPYAATGVIMQKAVGVDRLPEFRAGACSVQDTAAQIAAELLPIKAGDTFLDVCSAPGGKLAHILEGNPELGQADAIDSDETRVKRIQENLDRLRLTANCYVADATQEPNWPTPQTGYDMILVDAPCSGTGVVSRHPDIRHHRRASDIPLMVGLQAKILQQSWQLLKPGGQLMYTTCSILPDENEQQAKKFLQDHADATEIPLKHPQAIKLKHGVQSLQGVHSMDGFFYFLVKKQN